MRLISQDGNVDLSYENTIVIHAMEAVIALCNGEKYVLGEYSSKEKSYKAMEMLHEVYQETKLEEVYREGNYYFRTVFRFPKGEDVKG